MSVDAPFGEIALGFGMGLFRLRATECDATGLRLLVRLGPGLRLSGAPEVDDVAHRSGLLAESVDGDDLGLFALRRSRRCLFGRRLWRLVRNSFLGLSSRANACL